MATLAPYIFTQYFLDDGSVNNAGTITAYEAGTLTKKDIYTSAAGTTAHSNPFTLETDGRKAYYLGEGSYDFVIKDSLGNTIDTISDIAGSTGSGVNSLQAVETVAELKALSSGSSTYVDVGGYYANGDGGGGRFYWDSTSSASDNGGTILVPDSGPGTGRWLRIFSGNVKVVWFGTVADKGNGDTDNATAINATYTYARANGYNVEFQNRGEYVFNSAIDIQKVVTYGNNARLWKYYDGVGLTILTGGSTFTDVHDLRLDADQALTSTLTSHGLSIVNSRVRLYQVDIVNQKGNGLDYEMSGANGNHCYFYVTCGVNEGHGAYFHGAGLDLNDIYAQMRCFSNGLNGLWIDTPTKYWSGWYVGEDNGASSDVTHGSTIKLQQCSNMNLYVYLESGNLDDYNINADVNSVSLEGRLGSGTNSSDSTLLSRGGNVIIVKGSDSQTFLFKGTSLTDSGSKEMRTEYVGSSDDPIQQMTHFGNGKFELKAFDRGGNFQTLDCGELDASYDAVGDWSGVSDGQFGVDIGGGGVTNITCDFTGDSDMDDVAASIQTGLQVSFSNATCIFNVDKTRFELFLQEDAKTITVLTVGSGGTDISGVGSAYMSGTAALGAVISETGMPGAGMILDPGTESINFRTGGNKAVQDYIGANLYTGTGTPEAVKTAPEGSIYLNTDVDANNRSFYIKVSGSGNTGWRDVFGSIANASGTTLTFVTYNATSLTDTGTRYMDFDYVGDSSTLLLQQRVFGNGNVTWECQNPGVGASTKLTMDANNQRFSVDTGDVRINTVGKGLSIKEGSNAKMGTGTLSGGALTVSTTAVSTTSRIFLANTASVNGMYADNISNGVSFDVTGNGSDTFNWMIVDPA